VTVVTKTGNNIDMGKSIMNLEDMIRYKQKVIADVHECVKDLEHLKIEEDK
jgi:hypothetical protein